MGAAASMNDNQPADARYLEALKESNFSALSPEEKLSLLNKFQKEYVGNQQQQPKVGGGAGDKQRPQVPKPAAPAKAAEVPNKGAGQNEDELRAIFCKFALYGAGKKGNADVSSNLVEMDGSKFTKLCSNCKIIGNGLTRADVDMVFTKAKQGSASRKIGFASFQIACQMLAERKGITYDQLIGVIVTSGRAPVNNGTVAAPNRFYDDKSTWGKGVHAHGGPSTNDKRITLSNLADRSEADIRGRKQSDVLNAVVA